MTLLPNTVDTSKECYNSSNGAYSDRSTLTVYGATSTIPEVAHTLSPDFKLETFEIQIKPAQFTTKYFLNGEEVIWKCNNLDEMYEVENGVITALDLSKTNFKDKLYLVELTVMVDDLEVLASPFASEEDEDAVFNLYHEYNPNSATGICGIAPGYNYDPLVDLNLDYNKDNTIFIKFELSPAK